MANGGRQWVLRQRLGSRIKRWGRSRPEAAKLWGSFQADPGRHLGSITELLAQLMAGDRIARHLVDELVPRPEPTAHRIEYEDLVIAFEEKSGDDARLNVRMLAAPHSRRAHGTLEIEPLRHLSILPAAGSRHAWPGPVTEVLSRTPRAMGETLFRALFTAGMRDAWLTHRGYLQGRPDQGVRLMLVFDPRSRSVRQMVALPWELIHDPSSEIPLCKNVQTPLVRSLATVGRPGRALPLVRDVLLLHSLPPDQRQLDLAAERRAIEDALQPVRGAKVRAARACLDQLHTLRGAHVIHFMGHGMFDEVRNEGLLIFEGENQSSVPVRAEILVEQLANPRPQLMVLNACSSGQSSGVNTDKAFAGVAASLLEAGVPAVVAMQAPISDGAAIEFSSTLYEQLAQGSPTAAAVTEGRLAMSCANAESQEWATPALYVGRS